MINVKLIQCTGAPEKVIAAAAKLCYSAANADDILDGLDRESTDRFLNLLMDLGHESPIEHASFTFAIEGVSRSLLAQITRHRIASFSVKSQRYVREGQFSFILPPEIEAVPEAKERFLQSMEEDQRAYNEITELLMKKHYEAFLAEGMSEKKAKSSAEKKAIEDARFVLPNACETKMVMTMNARSLMNFFRLRCCNRAQWEIRELAEKMLLLVKKEAPTLFRLAGPGCLAGACPEGKMCCGKMNEVREKFLGGEQNG